MELEVGGQRSDDRGQTTDDREELNESRSGAQCRIGDCGFGRSWSVGLIVSGP